MQLYERVVSTSGRVTYREHKPVPAILEDKEIDTEEVVTLLCTLVISLLLSVSEQLQPHQKLAREVKLLEQAVLRFASLNGRKLNPNLIEVGVDAWNAAIKAMQDGLLRVRL